MGSSKKHKKDREVSSRRRSRSRSRSRSEEQRERKKSKKNREKDKERKHRNRRSEEQEKSYHSDSSDVVEIITIPEPPVISKPPRERQERQRAKSKSLSPIPTDGAGDVLSIEATNKLRAKLGLKPLEVGTSEVAQPKKDDKEEKDESVSDLKKIKDDWGEFYHKPAGVFNEKTEVELLREKIASKREKRKIEEKLARIKTLGESDSDEDADAWVNKNRKIEEEKKQAKKRAKMLDDMDENLEEAVTVRRRPANKMPSTSSSRYGEKDLEGLKVGHNLETFKEDRQVILTLQDQDVLGEDGDTLVNVNMIENERYQKNVEVRKQNPLHYGYDVYEDQYDEFGTFIGRGMLSKYDEVLDGDTRKTFTIGESRELIQQQQRKALEVKAKLQNKTLESLNSEPLRIASDHFTEEELTTFKKPKAKKKIKKIRQKLKADDIIELAGGDQTDEKRDFGSRNRKDKVEKKKVVLNEDMLPTPTEEASNAKVEPEDEDLEHMLSKARRLKQKEIIRKDVSMNDIKHEVKMEVNSDEEEASGIVIQGSAYITLNQTAEFCRTLGDIPTYGMAGNRDEATDMMDVDQNDAEDEVIERGRGKWNQVDPNDEPKLMEGVPPPPDHEDVAILDEEPDVACGVANALKLAMSKGYLEKDDSNRPSNSKLTHLQAQNYSIDDKNHGEDDKYNRRGGGANQHFNGPLSDFREKPGYHPNVKLEYIDDNNQKLTPKEAFRYLSHKFHGKGPGKNKIEKRLKKVEQEGLMKKMTSSDTPLSTLSMLQHKQKETQSPYIVLSGGKSGQATLGKNKR